MSNLDELMSEIVNLNADKMLSDEQIRKNNEKYVEEVLSKAGPVVPSNEAIADLEMTLKQKAEQMRNSKGTVNADSYPKTLPKKETFNPFTDAKITAEQELKTDKSYNPDDFFIIERANDEFIASVQEKLKTIYDAPHIDVDGKRVYQRYYYNVEAWCLELFFEAINWDVKIIETVMNDKNSSLRNDIAGVGFATLAYWARGKR